jgi:hypothetical protein
MDIAEGTITRSMLSMAESDDKFDKKQTKIMRFLECEFRWRSCIRSGTS